MTGTDDQAPETGQSGASGKAPAHPAAARAARRAKRRARAGRRVRRILSVAVILGAMVLGLWMVLSRPGGIALPDVARAQLEQALSRALPGGSGVSITAARLAISPQLRPRVTMADLALRDATGREIARLPRVQVDLSREEILRMRAAPQAVRIDGLRVVVDRDADGRFLLTFGQTALPPLRNIADLVALIDTVMARPPLSGIAALQVTDLDLQLRDARAGRAFQFRSGALTLSQTDTAYTTRLQVVLDPEIGTLDGAASATLRLTSQKGSLAAEFLGSINQLRPSVIAAQAPALAWLSALDAPVSASFRGQTDQQGNLGAVAGTVDLGEGAFRLGPSEISIDALKAYLGFDPVAQRITLQSLDLASSSLDVEATGHADLIWPNAQRRGALRGQLALEGLALRLPGLLEGPLDIARIDTDWRLSPADARLDIGQMVVTLDDTRAVLRGALTSHGPAGIAAALDLTAGSLTPQTVMALWPVIAAPKTRGFLSRNLMGGTLNDLSAAVRLEPGARPTVAISADFVEAGLRFLPQMPPVTQATGALSLIDHRLGVRLDTGQVASPDGPMRVDGTDFVVADTRIRPGFATVDLRLDGPLQGVLHTLTLPPVNFAFDPIPVTGRATLAAEIAFSTGQPPGAGEADWTAQGSLHDLASDTLLGGRALRADEMALVASLTTGLTLSGAVAVDGVPLRIALRRALGPDAPKVTEVDGSLQLSQETLDGFGIGLGGVGLNGAAPAQFAMSLRQGVPPVLTLTSALDGLGLSVPALAWRKPAAARGSLELELALGPQLGVPAFALAASDLSATGAISLDQGGGLQEARFDQVRLGGWLDVTARLTGRGAGQPPAIAITGGSVDARGLAALTGQAGQGARGPVSFSLDRLVLAQGVSVAPFSGELAAGRALNGRFDGRVNGVAPITAEVTSASGALALRVQSQDAGRVLAALGVLRNGQGGALDLTLAPAAPTQGSWAWEGQLRLNNLTVVDAPVLAELLSALSVVGALEQMATGGIVFSEGVIELGLSPQGLTLRDGRVFGPSMGLTIEGLIAPSENRIDVQGLISPFYLINGLGGLFFARRGEGLFGFTYRLEGALRSPQATVNPASILAPGLFRELFRRAPPGGN